MSTKVSEIKIIGDLIIEKNTASIEKVAKCFYGIIAIHFCNGAEKNFISVYTQNLGSVDSSELTTIKDSLEANSLSISTVGTYHKAKGLVYVLSYSKK
jgi:hypothetical protein